MLGFLISQILIIVVQLLKLRRGADVGLIQVLYNVAELIQIVKVPDSLLRRCYLYEHHKHVPVILQKHAQRFENKRVLPGVSSHDLLRPRVSEGYLVEDLLQKRHELALVFLHKDEYLVGVGALDEYGICVAVSCLEVVEPAILIQYYPLDVLFGVSQLCQQEHSIQNM